jgi:hypothetical protein
LGGSIKDVYFKKGTLKKQLLRLWHSKWKTIILEIPYNIAFFYGLCFNKTSKFCLFNCFQNFVTFLGWMTKYTWHPFIVSHFKVLALGLRTQNRTMSFMVPIMYPNHNCTQCWSFWSRPSYVIHTLW